MNNPREIKVQEKISISESISTFLESDSLLISSKNKIIIALSKGEDALTDEDIVDVFINLHIVLEVGINSFFRKLIIPTLKKEVSLQEMLENLDRISFLDKVIMFVYYSKFNSADNSRLTHYHSIIGKIKKFSEIRNKLLHGHSISSSNEEGQSVDSKLKKKINLETLHEQIEDFCFILDGLRYYLDILESPIGLTASGKESCKQSYLDFSFLSTLK